VPNAGETGHVIVLRQAIGLKLGNIRRYICHKEFQPFSLLGISGHLPADQPFFFLVRAQV
jgi:hypothetical protein